MQDVGTIAAAALSCHDNAFTDGLEPWTMNPVQFCATITMQKVLQEPQITARQCTFFCNPATTPLSFKRCNPPPPHGGAGADAAPPLPMEV